MYIEITPTEPLPLYPAYLDGNTATWDKPQLEYLDGGAHVNTSAPVLLEQKTLLFSRSFNPVKRYAYNFPHDTPQLCSGYGHVYFDGNKTLVTNVMYHHETNNPDGWTDGNAPSRIVEGLDIGDGYEFDEMTLVPAKTIYSPWQELQVGFNIIDLTEWDGYELDNADITHTYYWSGQGKPNPIEYWYTERDYYTSSSFSLPIGKGLSSKVVLADGIAAEKFIYANVNDSWTYNGNANVFDTSTSIYSSPYLEIYHDYSGQFKAEYYVANAGNASNWQGSPGSNYVLLLNKQKGARYRTKKRVQEVWRHYGPTTWPQPNIQGSMELLDNILLSDQMYAYTINVPNGSKRGQLFPQFSFNYDDPMALTKLKFYSVITIVGPNLERVELSSGGHYYMYLRNQFIDDVTLLGSPYHDGQGLLYPDKIPVFSLEHVVYDSKNIGDKYLFDNTSYFASFDGHTATLPEDYQAEEYKGVIMIQGILNWVRLRYNKTGLYDIVSKKPIVGRLPKNRKLFAVKEFNKILKP